MSAGKLYKVFFSTTGLAAGVMTEIEFQGDLKINPGRTVEKTTFKVGAMAAQGNDGWSCAFDMGPAEPLSTGQQLLWTQFMNGGAAYIEVKSATSGSIKHAGSVLVNISEITHPKSGVSIWSVECQENGVVAMTAVV